MIRKFGGAAGVESQPQGIDIGVGGGSNIKSIQRGVTQIHYSASSVEVTINSVDKTKSIIRLSQEGADGTSSGALPSTFIRGTFKTGEAKIVLDRPVSGGNANYSIYVYWEVIEFAFPVQSGVLTMGSNSANEYATITAINRNKSTLFFSYNTPNNAGSYFNPMNTFINGSLASDTLVYFGRKAAETSCSANIAWFVVEFK
ncbi:hypothetical protein GH811_19025 [Acetobacterium malicum]|uniref:Uncharacterized protein n=1 Tax=Acetobacterium malicum TaxID=52692 RepID=A0ABR6Z3I8_9FIRM|nr:hypothetical protein [Acetobacterium malicum]MBC3901686.1 hypothetical protein [Acetobacterium malicum]